MSKSANPPCQDIACLDLRSASEQQLRAIQKRAERDGISFEDAALRMLLELADKVEQQHTKGPIARLISFCRAH